MSDEGAINLPIHARVALAAIAKTLGSKALLPENILPSSAQFRDCIANHVVRLEHKPHSPKGARPRLKATYTVSIYGPRFDGRWNFNPGQLENLLRNLDTDMALPIPPFKNPRPRRQPLFSWLISLLKGK